MRRHGWWLSVVAQPLLLGSVLMGFTRSWRRPAPTQPAGRGDLNVPSAKAGSAGRKQSQCGSEQDAAGAPRRRTVDEET